MFFINLYNIICSLSSIMGKQQRSKKSKTSGKSSITNLFSDIDEIDFRTCHRFQALLSIINNEEENTSLNYNLRKRRKPIPYPLNRPSKKGYSITQILTDTLTNLTPEEIHELVQGINPKLFPNTGLQNVHPFEDGINLRDILNDVEEEEGYLLNEMMDKLESSNRRYSDNYQAHVVMVFLIQAFMNNNPVLLPTELNQIECLTEEQQLDLMNEENFTKNHVMALRYLYSLCLLFKNKNVFDAKKTKMVFLRAFTFLFEGPYSSLVIGGGSSRFTNLKIQIYHHVFDVVRQQRGRPRS